MVSSLLPNQTPHDELGQGTVAMTSRHALWVVPWLLMSKCRWTPYPQPCSWGPAQGVTNSTATVAWMRKATAYNNPMRLENRPVGDGTASNVASSRAGPTGSGWLMWVACHGPAVIAISALRLLASHQVHMANEPAVHDV
jgi:hypothetical protein